MNRIYRWVQRDKVAGIKSTHRADIAPLSLTGRRLRRLEANKGKSPERSGLQLDVEAALPIGKAAAIDELLKYACLQKP